MSGPKLKFVVLASGKGTNARALFAHARANPERFEPLALICDRPAYGAMQAAEEHGVPAQIVPHGDELGMLELLRKLKPQWALLAGYKRLVSTAFLDFFRDQSLGVARVLNVHPSLLPAYPGLNGYERAYKDGVKISGVTIHFVDAGLDTGMPVLQAPFAREESDSLESFTAKGRELEHFLYRRAIDYAQAGTLRVKSSAEGSFVSVGGRG